MNVLNDRDLLLISGGFRGRIIRFVGKKIIGDFLVGAYQGYRDGLKRKRK